MTNDLQAHKRHEHIRCVLEEFNVHEQEWFPVTGSCYSSLLEGYHEVMQRNHPSRLFRVVEHMPKRALELGAS